MFRKSILIGALLVVAVFHVAAQPASADACSIGYNNAYTWGTAIGAGYRSYTVQTVLNTTNGGSDPTGQRIAGRGIAFSDAISVPDFPDCSFTGLGPSVPVLGNYGDKNFFGFTGNYNLGVGGNDVVGGSWADNSANPCGENDFQNAAGLTMTGVTPVAPLPVSFTIGVNDQDGPRYNQTIGPDPGETDGVVDQVVAAASPSPLDAIWGENDASGGLDNTLDTLTLPVNVGTVEVDIGPVIWVTLDTSAPILGDLSQDSGPAVVTTCTNDNTVSPASDFYDCSTAVKTASSPSDSFTSCGTSAGGADGFVGLVFYEPNVVFENLPATLGCLEQDLGALNCTNVPAPVGFLYGVTTAGTMQWN